MPRSKRKALPAHRPRSPHRQPYRARDAYEDYDAYYGEDVDDGPCYGSGRHAAFYGGPAAHSPADLHNMTLSEQVYWQLFEKFILKDHDNANHFADEIARAQTPRDACISQLHVGGEDVSADSSKKPLLVQAARFGRTKIVERLVEMQCDVNIRDAGNGNTALHCAAFFGHPETVEALIRLGARFKDMRNDTGFSVARMAFVGREKFVMDEREEYRDSDSKWHHDPFFVCFDLKHTWPRYDQVSEILSLYYPSIPRLKITSVSRARRLRFRLYSRYILADDDNAKSFAADIARAQNPSERSRGPLIVGDVDISCPMEVGDIYDGPLLIGAAMYGKTKIVKKLVEMSCDINIKFDENTALNEAAYWGHAETFGALMKLGAYVDSEDILEWVEKGREHYLDYGDRNDDEPMTHPFRVCFDSKRKSPQYNLIVSTMRKRFPEILEPNMRARRSRRLLSVLYYKFIAKTKDDAEGLANEIAKAQTPEDLKISQLHIDMVDISTIMPKRYPLSNPLLVTAASFGKTNIVRKLVEMRCNVNIKTTGSENTALHEAAFWGYAETVEALIDLGAQV
jgi:ankyrin repeat protein